MKAQLKQEWVGALRSGKYLQGQSYLVQRHEDREDDVYLHCCLGVLAECAARPTGSLFGQETLDDINLDLLGPWDTSTENDSLQRQLAKMNDDGCTFDEIADWIEANVPAEA
jgi:hypothetical protein